MPFAIASYPGATILNHTDEKGKLTLRVPAIAGPAYGTGHAFSKLISGCRHWQALLTAAINTKKNDKSKIKLKVISLRKGLLPGMASWVSFYWRTEPMPPPPILDARQPFFYHNGEEPMKNCRHLQCLTQN
jgi:hypothetical protein